jgi:thiol:disulfide interchange protein
MDLENDEFLVIYDASKADSGILVETVKKTGFTARVVADESKNSKEENASLPKGFAVLDEALASAAKENKPLVLDFHALWCAPCQRMEREVFPDSRVARKLKEVVFVRIDTDAEPELSQKLGVIGLPDFRFVTSDGKTVRRTTGFVNASDFAGYLDELTK